MMTSIKPIGVLCPSLFFSTTLLFSAPCIASDIRIASDIFCECPSPEEPVPVPLKRQNACTGPLFDDSSSRSLKRRNACANLEGYGAFCIHIENTEEDVDSSALSSEHDLQDLDHDDKT